MKILNISLFTLVLLFSGANIFAQSNCDNLIKDAELFYENGNYDSVITLLTNGLNNCKLPRDKREEIYTLMIRAQIEKDNPDETDSLTYRLLKLNPNYQLEPAQSSVTFKNTLAKFHVRPLLTFGLMAGLNFSYADQLNTYSILDSADYSQPYNKKPGSQFNIMIEWEFYKNICLGAQAGINNQKYERVITGVHDWRLSFIEFQSGFQFPLYLKYYYPLSDFKPYVLFGYYFNILDSSTANVDLHYTAYNGISQTYDQYQQAANELSTYNMRTKNTQGLVFGLGCAYQIKSFRLSMDVRYDKSLTEYVNNDNRYSNSELIFNYYYVDNDMKLSKLELNVGIAYILLHHIKKKL